MFRNHEVALSPPPSLTNNSNNVFTALINGIDSKLDKKHLELFFPNLKK